MDLSAVEGLAHRLETLFSRVRQGALLLDSNVATVIAQVLDAERRLRIISWKMAVSAF